MENNNLNFDDYLSKEIKKMGKVHPSDDLWPKIDLKLREAKQHQSLLKKVLKIIWFITNLLQHKKLTSIGFGLIVIILTFWRIFLFEPDPFKLIKKAETKHLKAINQLEKISNKNKEKIDITLWVLYQERLLLLDESISKCKKTLKQNNQNVNAQKFLFLAYKEKTETLIKIINIQKGELL